MSEKNCKGGCGDSCHPESAQHSCCKDAVPESGELQVETLVATIKQLSADYENFRNRSEREKSRMYDAGKIGVIESLLPIVDTFSLAVANADQTDSFAKGVVMIKHQLENMLEDIGVTRIVAVGESFDTRFHNAVSRIDSEEAGVQEIVQELQAGYMYKESVIRHSMVIVAN